MWVGLFFLVRLAACYYIDEKYRESAVDVEIQEDAHRNMYISFGLNGIKYSSVVCLDKLQKVGRNSYATYNAVYTKKHEHEETSKVPSLCEALEDVNGWFIRDNKTHSIRGVLVDEGKIIHIKPKELLFPKSSPRELVAFVADEDFPEHVCQPIEMEPEQIECNEPLEDNQPYFERVAEYFKRRKADRAPPSKKDLLGRISYSIAKIRQEIFSLFGYAKTHKERDASTDSDDEPEGSEDASSYEGWEEANQRKKALAVRQEIETAREKNRRKNCVSCQANSLYRKQEKEALDHMPSTAGAIAEAEACEVLENAFMLEDEKPKPAHSPEQSTDGRPGISIQDVLVEDTSLVLDAQPFPDASTSGVLVLYEGAGKSTASAPLGVGLKSRSIGIEGTRVEANTQALPKVTQTGGSDSKVHREENAQKKATHSKTLPTAKGKAKPSKREAGGESKPRKSKRAQKAEPRKRETSSKRAREIKDRVVGNTFVTTRIPKSNKTVKKGEVLFLGIPYYSQISEVDSVIKKPNNYGFPVEKKAIPVAVAIDSHYIQKLGSRREAIFSVMENMNIASRIYEKSFNVLLYVSDIIIDQQAEWFYSQSALPEKLDQLERYRATKNKKCMLYHLVTVSFSKTMQIGLAWRSAIGFKSLKNISVSTFTQNQFITIAHEIGHNLGLLHDCDDQSCKNANKLNYPCNPCEGCSCKGQYIMNPKKAPNLLSFSPPAQKEMSIILAGLDTEMPNADEVEMPYPICGNGLVEEGEECDAGPFGDACCTPDCKLRINALCSDFNSGCCNGCQPAKAGTVCRKSQNECQKSSVCDGRSAKCPSVSFFENRKKCSLGFCANGVCTSKDAQCVMGGIKRSIVSAFPGYKGCVMKCLNINGDPIILNNRAFRDGTPCGWSGVCAQGKCVKDTGLAAMSVLAFIAGLFLIALALM
ncbi:uncharacterized protein NEMAJ01_0837 [Nematocida major]|uniref:uncharacterized protein n=1 Tax=Nematocida major TaxID=1912982 RepID=UPI0020077914|nr:uncharacterized protein NEMAJ01_0837 [Nematocida major]KAH9385941.1 hypothetical protein NEMAJ01_0837 [Nematocida major]